MKILSILMVAGFALYMAVYISIVAGFFLVNRFGSVRHVEATQTALPINNAPNTAWRSNYQLQPARALPTKNVTAPVPSKLHAGVLSLPQPEYGFKFSLPNYR